MQEFDAALDDVQAESNTSMNSCCGTVDLTEFFKNQRQELFGNSNARVSHVEFQPDSGVFQRLAGQQGRVGIEHSRRDRYVPFIGEFDGIVDQILQDVLEFYFVGSHKRKRRRIAPSKAERFVGQRKIRGLKLIEEIA